MVLRLVSMIVEGKGTHQQRSEHTVPRQVEEFLDKQCVERRERSVPRASNVRVFFENVRETGVSKRIWKSIF